MSMTEFATVTRCLAASRYASLGIVRIVPVKGVHQYMNV